MDQIAIIAVDAWSNLLLHCKAYIICICDLIKYTQDKRIHTISRIVVLSPFGVIFDMSPQDECRTVRMMLRKHCQDASCITATAPLSACIIYLCNTRPRGSVTSKAVIISLHSLLYCSDC
jgi:hypothetical protein